jgi:hypothetical protein
MGVKVYKDKNDNITSDEFSKITHDYENFFSKDYPILKSEILKITDDQIRLNVLIDLEKRCWDKLNAFHEQAVIDCFEPAKYFDSTGDPLDSMEKYNESLNSVYVEVMGTLFGLSFNTLKNEIRQLKEVLEIRSKYPFKKRPANIKKEKKPIDIKEEFLNLFKRTLVGEQVIQLFKTHEYIDKDERWIGLSKNKSELANAYNVLNELQLLKPHKTTPTAILFYNRFGLSIPGYACDKTLRSKPKNDDQKEFKKMFMPLEELNK